jgi:hypothetical protein
MMGRMYEGTGVLPDTIQILAPGLELAGVLASADRSALSDQELVWLAQARARQIGYEQAQQMADLAAIAPV